jgi:OOP family OmpA-OmpF porin
MKKLRAIRIATLVTLSIAIFAFTHAAAVVQTVQAVINGRSGATMTLQVAGGPNVTVLLTDSTDVGEVEGLLKTRSKQMSITSLIPRPSRPG